LDSTVLDDAVATQDTVTQLIAAIRRVSRVVPGVAAVIAEHCCAHDYAQPGRPGIAWNDSDARARLVDALVGVRTGCSGICPAPSSTPRPRRGWRCWRWGRPGRGAGRGL
jgi:hypothetical protein